MLLHGHEPQLQAAQCPKFEQLPVASPGHMLDQAHTVFVPKTMRESAIIIGISP